MTDVRIERDCLGEMEIPNDQYYGIQTHRMEKVSGTANLPVIFLNEQEGSMISQEDLQSQLN